MLSAGFIVYIRIFAVFSGSISSFDEIINSSLLNGLRQVNMKEIGYMRDM